MLPLRDLEPHTVLYFYHLIDSQKHYLHIIQNAHLTWLNEHWDKWNITEGPCLLLIYVRFKQLHMDICANITHIPVAEDNLIVSWNASI